MFFNILITKKIQFFSFVIYIKKQFKSIFLILFLIFLYSFIFINRAKRYDRVHQVNNIRQINESLFFYHKFRV